MSTEQFRLIKLNTPAESSSLAEGIKPWPCEYKSNSSWPVQLGQGLTTFYINFRPLLISLRVEISSPLEREIVGSNFAPVKLNTVLPISRHRLDISSKGAVLHKHNVALSPANSLHALVQYIHSKHNERFDLMLLAKILQLFYVRKCWTSIPSETKTRQLFARDIYVQSCKCKSNLSFYTLYCAEACNEFAGPDSGSLRPGNTAPNFRRNVAAVASRWQRCVWFDRPETWTSDLRSRGKLVFRAINRESSPNLVTEIPFSQPQYIIVHDLTTATW